jgi:hypothetical protein
MELVNECCSNTVLTAANEGAIIAAVELMPLSSRDLTQELRFSQPRILEVLCDGQLYRHHFNICVGRFYEVGQIACYTSKNLLAYPICVLCVWSKARVCEARHSIIYDLKQVGLLCIEVICNYMLLCCNMSARCNGTERIWAMLAVVASHPVE